MQVIVKGKNIEITDALREYAEQKVAKIGKRGASFMELEIRLSVEKNPSIRDDQKAELTLTGNGRLLRATDSDRDMYVAIDKALAKLQRQIKKYHDKQIDRTQAHESALRGPGHVPAEEEEEGAAPEPGIVKTKVVDLKPMLPEEATLQMDMLGFEFFVFVNSDTDQINVVYRRKDGNYGLMDTSR